MARPGVPVVVCLVAACLVGLVGCGGSVSSPGPSASASTGPSTSASTDPSAPASTDPPAAGSLGASPDLELVEYPVTAGSHPHDVAPAADGGVWYKGQRNGTLGHLDPATEQVHEIELV